MLMFWYAVLHVMIRLGIFMPYLRACDRLLCLAVWEDEG